MDPTTQWVVGIVCACSFGLGLLAGRDLKGVFTVKEIRAQLDLKVESATQRVSAAIQRELHAAKFRG